MSGAITTTTPPGPPSAPVPPAADGPPPTAAGAQDDLWPRTSRWMPWLIALFIGMVWLVPIDSIQVHADFPIDPKLDRIVLSAIALLWLASVFSGGRLAPRWRTGWVGALVVAFAGVALLSVVLNALLLVRVGEFDLATKKLGLLASYLTFFFVVATSLRPRELPRFALLLVALACVTAVGTLYEYWTHHTPFFDFWGSVLPHGAFDLRAPLEGTRFQTPPVLGPARHPLALAGMFGMALSFALVGVLRSKATRGKVLHGIAFALILGGVFATSRKTGTIASVAAVMTLLALRPRDMVRLAPAAVAMLLVALAIAPRAVEFQVQKLEPAKITQGASSEDRRSDYEAVIPDVRQHLEVGRGFGSYDPYRHRILDNNYLGLMLETGLVGLLVFGALILAVPLSARRAIRSRDPARWAPALAAAGGAAAFGVSMALFDAMSFAQVPYLFFLLAGIVVVSRAPEAEWSAGAGPAGAVAAAGRPVAHRVRALRPRPRAGAARTDREHAGARRRPPLAPGRRSRPAPSGRERRVRRPGRRGIVAMLSAALVGAALIGAGRNGGSSSDQLTLAPGGEAGDPFAESLPRPRKTESPTPSPPRTPSGPGGASTKVATPTTPTAPPAPEPAPPSAPQKPGQPGNGGKSGPGKGPGKGSPHNPPKNPPDGPSTPPPSDCLPTAIHAPGGLDVKLPDVGVDPCPSTTARAGKGKKASRKARARKQGSKARAPKRGSKARSRRRAAESESGGSSGPGLTGPASKVGIG